MHNTVFCIVVDLGRILCANAQCFIDVICAAGVFCEGAQVNLSAVCCTSTSLKQKEGLEGIQVREWQCFLTGDMCSLALNCISACCQHILDSLPLLLSQNHQESVSVILLHL